MWAVTGGDDVAGGGGVAGGGDVTGGGDVAADEDVADWEDAAGEDNGDADVTRGLFEMRHFKCSALAMIILCCLWPYSAGFFRSREMVLSPSVRCSNPSMLMPCSSTFEYGILAFAFFEASPVWGKKKNKQNQK